MLYLKLDNSTLLLFILTHLTELILKTTRFIIFLLIIILILFDDFLAPPAFASAFWYSSNSFLILLRTSSTVFVLNIILYRINKLINVFLKLSLIIFELIKTNKNKKMNIFF